MYFFAMYLHLRFLKENGHFWSNYTNNYLIDNKQNNWWYSVYTADTPKQALNYQSASSWIEFCGLAYSLLLQGVIYLLWT